MSLHRRGFLCGCLACLGGALARPLAASTGGVPPPLGFHPIAERIWLHTSWRRHRHGYLSSNGLVVIGRERALLIDTASTNDQTETLLPLIDKASGGLPIELLITHADADRMGGIVAAQKRAIPSMAHRLTAELGRLLGFGVIERAFIEPLYIFQLGGRRVEAFYPGPARSRDNAVAFIEDQSVLFGGCMIREAAQADLGRVADADLCAWPSALRAVQERYGAARIVVPGHGQPGDASLLAHTAGLVDKALPPSCS